MGQLTMECTWCQALSMLFQISMHDIKIDTIHKVEIISWSLALIKSIFLFLFLFFLFVLKGHNWHVM